MEKTIKSFTEYIDWIRDKNSSGEEIWFRGQRNDNWDLLPKLYRNSILDLKSTENGISKLNFKTPNFSNQFNEFKELAKDNKNVPKNLNDMQYLFLAQHHGLQTPLLDWSTDPLVSLYFALDGYEDNIETKSEDIPNPCVFMLRPELINRYSSLVYDRDHDHEHENIITSLCVDDNILNNYSIEKIISQNSPFNIVPLAIYSNLDFSHRISRQSGKFTVHGQITSLPSHPWYSTVVEQSSFGEKVIIDKNAVKELREILKLFSINKNTIYRKEKSNLDDISIELDKKYQLKK